MNIFLTSVLEELSNDFYRFLKFWFIDSLKFFFDRYLKNSSVIERRFSLRLNLKNFFEPLYGIRSIETYFYAIPLRTILILISISLHLLNVFFIFLFMLFWIILPFLLTYIFIVIEKWRV